MAMPTSGTYNWSPTAGETILYAFSEAGIRRSQITQEHLVDARMASNLILKDWSNDQPHLWQVDLQTIPLLQGVATYQLPGNTILVLDTYLRTFQLPNQFNVAPALSTTLNSPTVLVGLANHGLSPGNWVQFVVQVSQGGLIVYGYYQVVTVPNGNEFTIMAAANATATAGPGGAVPLYTTSMNSATVQVTLDNHGQFSGFTWNAPIATTVAGAYIQGAYTVQSVIDANNFTITVEQQAYAAATGSENGGQAQINGQAATVAFNDRITWPIGRSEYASYPNKQFQAPPTVNWFDRTITPTLTLYPAPDGFGPYELVYYRICAAQDVNGTFGETIDIPDRFLPAYQADLSLSMAVIYSPTRVEMLEKRRDRALGRAQLQDTEKVPLYIAPSFGSYNRRR